MKNRPVLLQIDNRAEVSYIQKQGCTQRQLPSRGSWSQYALGVNKSDGPYSNATTRSFKHWSRSVVFNQVVYLWGLPQIDLFASSINTKLPRLISCLPCHLAEGVYALLCPWNCILAYVFPPPHLSWNPLKTCDSHSRPSLLPRRLWVPLTMNLSNFPPISAALLFCLLTHGRFNHLNLRF